MLKYTFLTGLFFSSVVLADSMEGCYLSEDTITSLVSGKSESKVTYVNVLKISDRFFAEGIIWGGNYHICDIVSPLEGSDGPLPLKAEGNSLIYQESDPEADIDCKLEITFSNGVLKIKDANYHCAKYIFSCGARVGLDGVELRKSSKKCPAAGT